MNPFFRAFAVAACTLLVVCWITVRVTGRERAHAVGVADAESAAPVFTVEQATMGKAAYAKSCASCHLPDLSGSAEIPALAGKPFIDTWGARTTKELLEYMSAAMPYGGPSLSAETYIGILAYILQSNGATPGPEALSAATVARIDTLTAHSN